jgi:hypothetical protein
MRFFTLIGGSLAALAALGTASRADAGIIFGATAAGAAGHLYTLQPNGAMATDIGATNDAGGTNYPITGLAFHPTSGLLYGSTGNNPSTTAARLVTIDPATALVTVIGAFDAGPTNTEGVGSTMTDLAFDASGNLYGVGSIGGPQLYSINPLTGKATVIGGTGLTSTSGGALAIDSAGAAYGSPTGTRFGTYNTTTGAFTLIANPVEPTGGGAWGAFDFDETGALYGLNVGAGSPPPTALATFNKTTGAVTNLGSSIASLDAIAILVPEPGSAGVLLIAGAAALTARSRRRTR